ncbi:serine protease [Schizosaccharomyces japonicus yFS275]|uniref:Serine protease n=1 Tax=Schizosaccharomyces japonicus (strain yFS275 / FY16936) TaxID=402676 RepID=B6JWG1_SCHJY|nr:serine protease [Schizosaccharomyces japonicus yFS275]EEB05712.1 serine protease [Schizosaccharomyces japonicus yFS275]
MTLKKRTRIGTLSKEKRDHLNDNDLQMAVDSVTLDEIVDDSPPRKIFESGKWKESISRVVKSVVSIRFSQVASFDTDGAQTGEASAFIVDAENGYMMTNRHVACAGPFVGRAVLDNHEEVEVYPIYRDPVHDFGILKFDPKKIRYMKVQQLEMRPDLAKVGKEIRVVGNDAAEKLSILAGWISRVDRNVPEYGEYTYCDFNTSYIQAAANASGGSSGSPVVDSNGYVVALQAGGHLMAATDYFLPLDRPLRALRCLQQNKPITRGTIQAQLLMKPFDECSRFGLPSDVEKRVRKLFPEATNMLVVENVLPEGPSYQKLQEGDILLCLNGSYLVNLIELESVLDELVGQDVQLTVQRGPEKVELTITVGNTHAIAPDRYVEVCGATFHNLSYQLARQYALPVRRVFISEPTGSFYLEGSDYGYLLESIAHKPVPDLDAFIEVMKTLPDRKRVVVTYRLIHDMHTLCTAVVDIDRHWARAFRLVVRNDQTGLWDFTNLADPVPSEVLQPQTASIPRIDVESFGPTAGLVNCFVTVDCYLPVRLDGYPRSRSKGTALILDTERGLAVTSRYTIPFEMLDINITIANSVVIPAKAVFLHPTQNLAFIRYDPKLVGDTPLRAAKLSDVQVQQGDTVNFFGFNVRSRVMAARTSIIDITTHVIPHNLMPRYRAYNIEAITIESNLGNMCESGVLADDMGEIVGLWLMHLGEHRSNGSDAKYQLGISSRVVLPILKRLQNGETGDPRLLNVEVRAVQIYNARSMGLTQEWVQKFEQANERKRQLFMVTHVEAGTKRTLTDGDLLLTINGKLVTSVEQLEVEQNVESVEVEILRYGELLKLTVPTFSTKNTETDHVVICWGAVLQAPHRSVRMQSTKLPSQVYVTTVTHGSPADQFELGMAVYITAVNGVPTPDLDAFVREIRKVPDNSYVRVKTVSFDYVNVVLTIKMNKHYFPTVELVKDESTPTGWRATKYGENSEGSDPSIALTVDDNIEFDEQV